MSSARAAKKNGSIEIRLPDQTKAAFMEQCRREGLTASEAVRSFIDEQLMPRQYVRQRRVSHWRIGVAAVAGAVLGGGVAAPSIANSAGNTRPAFQDLDRDHNGTLTPEEFASGRG